MLVVYTTPTKLVVAMAVLLLLFLVVVVVVVVLVVVSIWSCLEIRMQDRIKNILIGYKSFETVEQFKCLETTLTNLNSTH